MAGEPVAHSRLLKTRLAHHGNRRDEARRLAWLFVTPFAVLCFLFIVAPVLATVGLSFFRKHPFFLEFQFNGWNNYAYVFSDRVFWSSLRQAILWTFSSIALQTVLGVGIALLLHQPLRGINIFRYRRLE